MDNPDTVFAIEGATLGAAWINRSIVDAREDEYVVAAVKATGRKKLEMARRLLSPNQ